MNEYDWFFWNMTGASVLSPTVNNLNGVWIVKKLLGVSGEAERLQELEYSRELFAELGLIYTHANYSLRTVRANICANAYLHWREQI